MPKSAHGCQSFSAARFVWCASIPAACVPAIRTGPLAPRSEFGDGLPLLIIWKASLADLNGRLSEPLPMNRFRPNIVLSGVEPYAEDRMRDLYSNGVRLRITKPCTRCVITTTDQMQGV